MGCGGVNDSDGRDTWAACDAEGGAFEGRAYDTLYLDCTEHFQRAVLTQERQR
ncbi:hypothetical protein [Streptomyces sp. NPDC047061]|uniref:hypothetical protein n=1 Tax=Streptomyces sp. NPDC047061 TaxID=3154605 RepID=UPI0033FC6817